MRLCDVQEVLFEEVMQKYLQDFGTNNEWEIENLKSANQKFGRWLHAVIPKSDIGEVIVPFHNRGGAAITPESGTTLEEAFRNFKANRQMLEVRNALFCKNFEFHKSDIIRNGIRAVYLSQEPLLTGPSYSQLGAYQGRITHLDGFHRLMAWMDLPKPDRVECYIAVYPSFRIT